MLDQNAIFQIILFVVLAQKLKPNKETYNFKKWKIRTIS